MPRKCKICNHPQSKSISSQLTGGASYRNISQRFGMDAASVFRHAHNCLTLDAQTLQQQIKKDQAIDHHAQLANMLDHALKHQRAAARWLQDPDDPNEFAVEPHADEIEIIYTERLDYKEHRVRRSLQDIIDEIKDQRPKWLLGAVNINTADCGTTA